MFLAMDGDAPELNNMNHKGERVALLSATRFALMLFFG